MPMKKVRSKCQLLPVIGTKGKGKGRNILIFSRYYLQQLSFAFRLRPLHTTQRVSCKEGESESLKLAKTVHRNSINVSSRLHVVNFLRNLVDGQFFLRFKFPNPRDPSQHRIDEYVNTHLTVIFSETRWSIVHEN
jgi:hypothetical protein